MSSVMMGAHKREGHGVMVTTPISKKSTKTAGILFVNDTNLWAGLDSEKDLETAVWEAQEGVNL